MLLAGLFAGEAKDFHPGEITALSFGAFAYLVFIGAIVGYTAYFWLLRHCDPAKVATYAYVNPIVAVLLGAFLSSLNTRLTTFGLADIRGGMGLGSTKVPG